MNTLLTASGRSHGQIRAAVMAALLAVAGCFGAAIGTLDSSLQATDTVAPQAE